MFVFCWIHHCVLFFILVVPIHLTEIFPDRYFRVCTGRSINYTFDSHPGRRFESFGCAGSHEDFANLVPAYANGFCRFVHLGTEKLTNPAADSARYGVSYRTFCLVLNGYLCVLSTYGSIRGASSQTANNIGTCTDSNGCAQASATCEAGGSSNDRSLNTCA